MTSHKMMSSVIYNNDLLLYRSSLSFMVSTLSSSLLDARVVIFLTYEIYNIKLLLVTCYQLLVFFCTFYLFFELISLSFLLYKQNTDQLNTFLYDLAKLRAVRGSCPTCSRALRALVSYMLSCPTYHTCSRALRASCSTCSSASRASCFTCLLPSAL